VSFKTLFSGLCGGVFAAVACWYILSGGDGWRDTRDDRFLLVLCFSVGTLVTSAVWSAHKETTEETTEEMTDE